MLRKENQSTEPANRKVMRQFLATPILVGTLLFVCGMVRGYQSSDHHWTHAHQDLPFQALGLLFVVVVLRTIHRLFREVLETKDRLSSVIRSMADTLFVVHPDGSIAMVNQTALELLGYANIELVGTPAGQVLHDLDDNPIFFSDQNRQELVRDLEGILVTKDQRRIPVLISGASLTDSKARKLGTVCVARDISQRKKSEEDAKRIQLQLMQASKLASLGTIGSGVAHEIKNPLTVVKASAELILTHRGATAPIKREAKEIIRCSERIHKITDHLLTFARERKKDDRRKLDINQPISESLILLRARFEGKDISVKLNLGADLPRMWGDTSELESIFQNLLGNSLDAFDDITDKRSKQITITSFSSQPDLINVTYEDNATGIAANIVDRVFDPFFTTKEIGKGTGLGMSIIHGIMERNRGKITLDTEVGRGTKFSLTFPVDRRSQPRPDDKAEMVQSVPPPTEERKQTHRIPTGRKPTILIVDDEPRIAELLKKTLCKHFTARVFNDSREACKEIADKRYDMIISDMQMPHMSGTKVLAQAKQCQPDTPFILMTGYGENDPKVKEALANGALAIIDKPFSDPISVRNLLLDHLNASRSAHIKKAA